MYNDIFYKNCASIDLHGYDMESARVATNDFINESFLLKRNCVIIIHGIGKGLVKASVHNTLKRNKKVKKYFQNPFNEGITIVEIYLDKQ